MMSFEDSVFARILRWLGRSVIHYPKYWVIPQLVLFVLSLWGTFHWLNVDTNRNDLIGEKSKYHQVYLKFQKEFPVGDDLVVVAEGADPERNRQFIERLGAKVAAQTNLFADVIYKADLSSLGPKGLMLAPTNDLEDMRRSLHEYRPFIQQFAQVTNLNSFFEAINRQFLNASGESNVKPLLQALPFLQSLVRQARDSLQRTGTPPPPGVGAMFGGGEEALEQIYVTYDHGRMFLLSARAKDNAQNPQAIDRMRALIQETTLELPGLNVGLTGEPVLDYDEMRQSEQDSFLASVLALVLCSAIFIVSFHQVGRPVKAAICLVIGLGCAMGFTTVAIGHLNILTVTFAPMLIGLAIDFGVHFTTRYEEEMRHGLNGQDASSKATIFTGQGIVTGAMTTAAAFLAMALTRFKGIQEMGVICGVGLLICLVPMMTILPLLLMRGGPNVNQRHTGRLRLQVENLWLQRPWLILVITMALCIGAAIVAPRVSFDYDLLNMQTRGLPSVEYEKQLLRAADKSLLFAAVIADSPQQAVAYQEKLKRIPAVATVESVAQYFADDPHQKQQLIRAIQAEVADIRFAPVDTKPVDLEELGVTLWSLKGYLGLAADQSAQSDPALSKQLRAFRDSVEDLSRALFTGGPQIPVQLAKFQQSFFDELHESFAAIRDQDTRGPLRPQDLPPALRNRFIGVTGKYLVQVYPKKDVWQRPNQEEFIRELRTVVPEDKMTGTPIELYAYTTLLKDSYQQAAYYALVAIIAMVYLHFQSLLCVLLCLLPVGVGGLWLLGFLGITGMPFNPANIMTLPLVIGIGVTNGIQILNRFAEEQNPAVLAKSTGKAVLVSGLTAIAGFGSLMLAKHQGIRSLGIVMSVGIAGCMIAGLTFLPAILALLMKRGWTVPLRKNHPKP